MVAFIKTWRWGLLSLVCIALLLGEAVQAAAGQPIDVFELSAYLIFSVLLGFTLEAWARAQSGREIDAQALACRQKLSDVLTTYTEWNELAAELAKFPAAVARVDQSSLLLCNPITQQFESVASWRGSDEPADDLVEKVCSECIEAQDKDGETLRTYTSSSGPAQRNYYCLSVRYRGSTIAYLQFRTKAGVLLSAAEKELFASLNNDLALALTAGQDRSRLAEMRSADAALTEHRNAARHLHSRLDQYISTMRSKLGRLTSNPDLQAEEIRAELKHLRETAEASYEAIQGESKSNHPDTPQLNGLLHEHARKTAERAHIILTFKTEGRALPVNAEIQQNVLAAFQEIFKNIEKHSKATKVSVFIGWAFDILTISVIDNGVGFSMNGGRHFGLEVMRDRITALDGQIDLRSTPGEGTSITFIIPNLSERLISQLEKV